MPADNNNNQSQQYDFSQYGFYIAKHEHRFVSDIIANEISGTVINAPKKEIADTIYEFFSSESEQKLSEYILKSNPEADENHVIDASRQFYLYKDKENFKDFYRFIFHVLLLLGFLFDTKNPRIISKVLAMSIAAVIRYKRTIDGINPAEEYPGLDNFEYSRFGKTIPSLINVGDKDIEDIFKKYKENRLRKKQK